MFTTEFVTNLHVLSHNNSRFYASGINDRKRKKKADDGISKTLKPDISGHRLSELSLVVFREFQFWFRDTRLSCTK